MIEQKTDDNVRHIPIGVTFLVIFLCLGGGGYFLYRQYKTPKVAGVLNVTGGSIMVNGSVTVNARKEIIAKANDVQMVARPTARGNDVTVMFPSMTNELS